MPINDHRELWIYQEAYALALEVFKLAAKYPPEELYRLTDQSIRSSRAPAAMIAEAFRRRHYPLQFKSKLTEAESEAAETQVWLSFARDHGYAPADVVNELIQRYITLLVALTNTRLTSSNWCTLEPREESEGAGNRSS